MSIIPSNITPLHIITAVIVITLSGLVVSDNFDPNIARKNLSPTPTPSLVLCYVEEAEREFSVRNEDECNKLKESFAATNKLSITPSQNQQVQAKRNIQPTTAQETDPVIKCNGQNNCSGKFLMVPKSQCVSGEITCCQVNGTWSLMKKDQCATSNNAEKVAITLPHNGQRYYCVKGIDDDMYNDSQIIKNLRDKYDANITRYDTYAVNNCYTAYDDLNQACWDYVNGSKEDAKNILLDAADKNEKILNKNIEKFCN